LSRCRTLCVGLLIAVSGLPVATADAKRITFGERDLRQGMKGTDVRVLQGFLTKAGIKTTVDGRYGPRTTSNVRRWERKVKLPVDGRVPKTDAATLRMQVEQGTAGTQAVPVAAAPTANATLGADGKAIAPVGAPPEVVAVIAAANEIVGKPYRYGGGHGDFEDSGYDCSGAVSYALHGGDLLDAPLDSSGLESFGESGPGEWITVYAHGSHAYVVIAGLRFDTSGSGEEGPRWRPESRSGSGYTVRHPAGL
jgi:hypothetical protein